MRILPPAIVTGLTAITAHYFKFEELMTAAKIVATVTALDALVTITNAAYNRVRHGAYIAPGLIGTIRNLFSKEKDDDE